MAEKLKTKRTSDGVKTIKKAKVRERAHGEVERKKNRERGLARANWESGVRERGERGEGESQDGQKGRLVLGLWGHFNATLHSVKILVTPRLTAFDQTVCQRQTEGERERERERETCDFQFGFWDWGDFLLNEVILIFIDLSSLGEDLGLGINTV